MRRCVARFAIASALSGAKSSNIPLPAISAIMSMTGASNSRMWPSTSMRYFDSNCDVKLTWGFQEKTDESDVFY